LVNLETMPRTICSGCYGFERSRIDVVFEVGVHRDIKNLTESRRVVIKSKSPIGTWQGRRLERTSCVALSLSNTSTNRLLIKMTTIKDESLGPNSKSQSTSTSQSSTPHGLPESTDVLIVGAGPVGLLIAYQLSKFDCHNYVIIGECLASSSSQIHILYTLSA
jgi:hypothetical protein